MMSDVVDIIRLDPKQMTLTINFNNASLTTLKLNKARGVILKQIKKALEVIKVDYDLITPTLDLGKTICNKNTLN